VRLPHGWWLWGIDVQFDSYIDAPQMDYFQTSSPRRWPGDQIILCTATPEWVDAHRDAPESYRNLDYFDREVIAQSGGRLCVALSGHHHHYARYAATDGRVQRITAGGGGAYLSATHGLPEQLRLPPAASTDRHKSAPPVDYLLAARYPDTATSRRLGRGVWRLLPARNLRFVGLLSAIYAFYAWAVVRLAARGSDAPDLATRVRDGLDGLDIATVALGLVGTGPALTLSVVALMALHGLTKRRGLRRLVVGTLHTAVQATVLVVVLMAAVSIAGATLGALGAAAAAVAIVIAALLGALAAPAMLAAYLRTGDTLGRNVNEQFSAMRLERFKNALRLHVGADGTLTIFPLGIRDVVHDWVPAPDAGDQAPYLRPGDGARIDVELIEPPVRIDRSETA
jgi:hypothetical protein